MMQFHLVGVENGLWRWIRFQFKQIWLVQRSRAIVTTDVRTIILSVWSSTVNVDVHCTSWLFPNRFCSRRRCWHNLWWYRAVAVLWRNRVVWRRLKKCQKECFFGLWVKVKNICWRKLGNSIYSFRCSFFVQQSWIHDECVGGATRIVRLRRSMIVVVRGIWFGFDITGLRECIFYGVNTCLWQIALNRMLLHAEIQRTKRIGKTFNFSQKLHVAHAWIARWFTSSSGKTV